MLKTGPAGGSNFNRCGQSDVGSCPNAVNFVTGSNLEKKCWKVDVSNSGLCIVMLQQYQSVCRRHGQFHTSEC